jgi:hypothetical protein
LSEKPCGAYFFAFFENFFVPILTSGGYVGLSIATLLSQHHKVMAVDIVPEKVELINSKKSPIQDEYIEKYLAEKELNLTATLDAKEAYSDADFVVIAAPTNYDSKKNFFDNAGALFKIKDKLTEDFLLLNADAMFDVDFNRFVEYHKRHGGLVTLFTHPNSHPYDSGLIIADKNGAVEKWLAKEDERPKYYRNRVNAGLHVINPEILALSKIDAEAVGKIGGDGKPVKVDLDRQLLKPLAGTGKMFCYDSPEYVKDMGTPDRYYSVCADYREGRVTGKNLKNKQKAIFLDRDGTINKYVGFLRNIDDFELIDGVAEAIRKINESGYLAIVVTNQPVIARGEVSFDELDEIHNKMETLLGKEGAYLDAIYALLVGD